MNKQNRIKRLFRWKIPKPKIESGKIRIPQLLLVKRIVAAIVLMLNFSIAQASLLSAADSQGLYWFFMLNAFIALDYLWKTRRGHTPQPQKKWGEQQ